LLIGTRRGLFVATSDRDRREWSLDGPHIAGYEVYHAVFDPRDDRTAYAAANHAVWGAHLYRSADGGARWEQLADRPAFPAESGHELRAIWHLQPDPIRPRRLYAGTEPGALFISDDGGESWTWAVGLEEHPTRTLWQPAKGGLALHSVQVDPRDPDRLYIALSAGGVYRSDDDARSWKPINRGVRADFLPEPYPVAGQCVHSVRLHAATPDRLYQQNHCGLYRSDDRGENWTEISEGLPSDFGYVVGLDPGDPDRCWVIPEESSHLRSVCGGRLRVFESGDAGASWTARHEGLPQAHAYVSVLRESMATDGLDPCGVYFGTSTGHLFGSPDGRSWTEIAGYLPKILSVTAAPGTARL
jgi:hypothetical protein